MVDAIDLGPAFPIRVYLGFALPDQVVRVVALDATGRESDRAVCGSGGRQVVRVVALDATGRELGRSSDLPARVDETPTDTPVLVATQTSATGTRKLYAYHAHRASCVRVVDVDGREAVHACQPPGSSKDAIDPSALGRPPLIIAYGGLPRAARTVRFTAVNGPPIQVRASTAASASAAPTTSPRSPCGRRGGELTVLDARGDVIGTSGADPRC